MNNERIENLEYDIMLYFGNMINCVKLFTQNNLKKEKEDEIYDILAEGENEWYSSECDPEGPTPEQNKILDKILEKTAKKILEVQDENMSMRIHRTDGRIHTCFDCGCTEFQNMYTQRTSIHYDCPHRQGQHVPMFSVLFVENNGVIRWHREKEVENPLPGESKWIHSPEPTQPEG